MIDEDVLLKSVIDATAEVFSTMLDMQVQYTGPAGGPNTPEQGLISLVGITGDWGGSGVFCCTPVLARTLWSRMLGCDPNPGSPSIDDEVLDVVSEITNMMVGNIKNGLEEITGPLAISVPTVIHGKNFRFRNGAGKGVVAAFTAEGEVFEVRISLARVSERANVSARVPVLGLAQY